jgi:hypothetical protein
MAKKVYVLVSGIIFGLVAIAHAVRLLNHLSIQIGGFFVPMCVSWLGVLAAAALCIWAFWSAKQP